MGDCSVFLCTGVRVSTIYGTWVGNGVFYLSDAFVKRHTLEVGCEEGVPCPNVFIYAQ